MDNIQVAIIILLVISIILSIWRIIDSRQERAENKAYDKTRREVAQILKEFNERVKLPEPVKEETQTQQVEQASKELEEVPRVENKNIKTCGNCKGEFDWTKGRCPCYDKKEIVCGLCKEPVKGNEGCKNPDCSYNNRDNMVCGWCDKKVESGKGCYNPKCSTGRTNLDIQKRAKQKVKKK